MSFAVLKVSFLNSARGSGEHCELLQWVWVESSQQTVSGVFWVESHASCDSAIAEEFRQSDTYCDPCWTVTYWYGISQKRSGAMVSSWPQKFLCDILSHFHLCFQISLKRKQDIQYNVQMANCKYLCNEVPGTLCTNANAM